MNQVFVTLSSKPLARWLKAFPDLEVISHVAEVPENSVVWLDLATLKGDLKGIMQRLTESSVPFVVLSSVLSEGEGLQVIQAGAAGYVHRLAGASQLKEVALVIEHGGLWVGAQLLQRVVGAAQTIAQQSGVVPSEVAEQDVQKSEVPEHKLTERELAVAREVGRGATNREIAERLNITERTVKAHLSVVFEKLVVRDRVQLALLMNNISL